jgi:hypothetical protein
LSGSASHIAVPAALPLAQPAARPSLYLPLSLGVTFPFNLALGIPIYMTLASLLRTPHEDPSQEAHRIDITVCTRWQGNLGRPAPRRRRRAAGSIALIYCIIDESRVDSVIEPVFTHLAKQIGIVTVSDVQVGRPELF